MKARTLESLVAFSLLVLGIAVIVGFDTSASQELKQFVGLIAGLVSIISAIIIFHDSARGK